MNTNPLRLTTWIAATVIIVAVLVGAGSAASDTTAPQPWFWPPAPEKPRIQHLKTFITPQDLDIKKGFFARVWEFIAGKDTVDRIVSPHGITADGEGKVYVADWGAACIHYFDFEKKKYDKFNRTKDSVLASPIDVALDRSGLLYVSDSVKRRIFVYDGSKNKRVIGDDSLLRPTGIAINREAGILYVVDTLGHRVHIYDLSGRQTATFGSQGAGDGQFNYPTHIALDRAGDVYIMDSMNFRVQIFDKTGKFLSRFGSNGTGLQDFMKPKGIAVDSDGHVWVSDNLRNTIQVFDRSGKLLLIFGRMGIGRGEFNIPAGLFIDAKDRLYVADSYNYRVQVFQYLKQ